MLLLYAPHHHAQVLRLDHDADALGRDVDRPSLEDDPAAAQFDAGDYTGSLRTLAALRAWRDAKTKFELLDTIPGGPGYSIRKLRYEALPGLWIPGLLYLPEKITGKVPVHLAVNGHDGVGKAAPYKQIRCINLAKRGVISLNLEWLGMGQLRTPGFAHYAMNQLDLCGSSGIAPFYLAMSRALDILLALPEADPTRVAVSGLSGGGWQTIFISSLDTRVTLANPVAAILSAAMMLDWLGHPETIRGARLLEGAVASVAFYQNGSLLGSDTTQPFKIGRAHV